MLNKILTILLLFFGSAMSQTPDSLLVEQKNYADSLFEAGNFYQSITEYKRLKFFDSDNTYEYYTDYKIGIAYKHGGFFNLSLKFMNNALSSARTDDEKLSAQIEIVKTLVLNRKTDKALNYLDKMETENYDEKLIDYWRGWAHLFAGNLNLSRNYFERSGKASEIIPLIASYADSLYSVSTAKTLSYILPGAGQFYTGEYFSGTMSFLWNALWIYVTANALIDGRIIEGLLVGDLLWLRFYRGNIQNAEKFANEKNVKLLNRLLENLQNNFKGEKP